MLLWLIPATIASRSINICSEIQPKSSDKVPCQSSIHPSSLMENLCAIPLLFFVMQPSRKYNLQCLYDLYCIRSSTLPTIIYLRNNMEMLMGFCLSTSMNEYPDVTHLYVLIVVYRVIQFTSKIQYTGTTVSTTKCNVLAYNHINVMQGR